MFISTEDRDNIFLRLNVLASEFIRQGKMIDKLTDYVCKFTVDEKKYYFYLDNPDMVGESIPRLKKEMRSLEQRIDDLYKHFNLEKVEIIREKK